MSAPPTSPTTDRAHARRPGIDRQVARRLATTEYDRVGDLLERLTPEQWAAPTDCPGWDVRAMAGHMLGMMQAVASRRELVRQVVATLRARGSGELMIDVLTALQVRRNASMTPAEVVAEVRRTALRAVRGRTGLPDVLRRQSMADEQYGWWTFAYLIDVIFTRDPFMHRIDISRATGIPMVATPQHEGVIVDDVVKEWAGRHGSPFVLELTGPAGGRWQEGEDGERISMDAFEFCRAVSGRAPVTGLLTTQVPF
ncbi:maleylpyruvate isomerase family mycothiol-dependent enzyme [Ornithinimicrobium sp. W1665]|uniref:maleylpyruvate isomerase family mycothiol-dependent enzyme n=1 Tax=Ornithinimicrobium sp. W1665 TaxID=3416666 RepID=UPI003CEA08EA